MDLIPSFSVDHRAIIPGIFTSRVDTVENGTVTTYDIRLTRPNREPAVDVGAMYITNDGKTQLYITVTALDLSRTVYFSQDVDGGVAIDWGDGSEAVTVSGTGNCSAAHDYAAPGEYMIALLPADGCTLGLGNESSTTQAVMEAVRLNRVEIGRGVMSIGAFAFQNCYALESVTIPDSVTSLGNYAFRYCYALQSITIPGGVASIGNNAFYSCYALESVTIPDGVTSIGDYAFYGCSGLTSVTIPDSVTSIGDSAFNGCGSLTSVTIPNSVTSIGESVFSDCSSLTSIEIPNGVTSIGYRAFGGLQWFNEYHYSE